MSQKKDTYEDLLKKCNVALYEQSSKVSTICRGMVYAVIASTWAMLYDNGHFYMPEGIMLWTLGVCALFILVDIVHYFCETCFNYCTSQRVFKEEKQSEPIREKDLKKFVRNSKCSFWFVVSKFALSLFVIVMFACAIIFEK